MKRGKLKSGRSGKKVASRKQAIAIALSEARKKGAKVPGRNPLSEERLQLAIPQLSSGCCAVLSCETGTFLSLANTAQIFPIKPSFILSIIGKATASCFSASLRTECRSTKAV